MCPKTCENPTAFLRFYRRIFLWVLASSFLKTKQNFTLLNLLLIVLPYFVAVCWPQGLGYVKLPWGLTLRLLSIASLLGGTTLPSPAFPLAGRAKRSHKASLPAAMRSQPCNPFCWQFHRNRSTLSLRKTTSARCTGGDVEAEGCWLMGID